MKRKIYCSLMAAFLAVMVLNGCGKDVGKMDNDELYAYLMDMDESKREDFIKKLDDEQQLRAYAVIAAADVIGIENGSTDSEKNEDSKENEDAADDMEDTETVVNDAAVEEYAPTEEILNASFADGKVQIGNTVFQTGGVLTLGEFVEKYSDEWALDGVDLDSYYQIGYSVCTHSLGNKELDIKVEVEVPDKDAYLKDTSIHVKRSDLLVMNIKPRNDETKKNLWYAGGVNYLDTGYTWENYTQMFTDAGYIENNEVAFFNDVEGFNGKTLSCLCSSGAVNGKTAKLTYEMEEERKTGEMVNLSLRVEFPSETSE